MRLAFVAMVMTVLALPAPAAAAPLAAGLHTGPGWVIIEGHSTESFDIVFTFYPASGPVRSGYATGIVSYAPFNETGYGVEVDSAVWLTVATPTMGRSSVDLVRGGRIPESVHEGVHGVPRDYKYLVWAAGAVDRFTYEVDASAGSTFREVARGDGAFYSDGSDASGASVVVNSGVGQASVERDVALRFSVAGHFVGIVGPATPPRLPLPGPKVPGEVGVSETVLETPTGRVTCPCSFSSLDGVDNGPGDDVVHRNSTRMSVAWQMPLLAGVDVVLPG